MGGTTASNSRIGEPEAPDVELGSKAGQVSGDDSGPLIYTPKGRPSYTMPAHYSQYRDYDLEADANLRRSEELRKREELRRNMLGQRNILGGEEGNVLSQRGTLG